MTHTPGNTPIEPTGAQSGVVGPRTHRWHVRGGCHGSPLKITCSRCGVSVDAACAFGWPHCASEPTRSPAREPDALTVPGFVNEGVWRRLLAAAQFANNQWHPNRHPYTCGKRSGHPSRFGDAGVLLPAIQPDGSLILVCPDCDYRQSFPNVEFSDTAAWPEPENDLLRHLRAPESGGWAAGATHSSETSLTTEGQSSSVQTQSADALREALEQAAAWFDEYGCRHEDKGDIDKAQRNFDRANYCKRALARSTHSAETQG
jgi:hypothetical protein